VWNWNPTTLFQLNHPKHPQSLLPSNVRNSIEKAIVETKCIWEEYEDPESYHIVRR
jgi:hypothetical protein